MCEITYVDGDSLRLTDNHTMSTTTGWRAINPEAARAEIPSLTIGQLEEGDEIIRFDEMSAQGGSAFGGREVGEVESYACWSERQQTYNLILDGNVNTYFADGYLAHNKSPSDPGFHCPAGTTRTEKTPSEVHITTKAGCRDHYAQPTTFYGGDSSCTETGSVANGNLKHWCPCHVQLCLPNCTDTTWSACTVPCGGGTQVSNCGTRRTCNTNTCLITGAVYYDPNNTCSTSTPQNIGGGLSTVLRGTAYSDNVWASGGYRVIAPAGTYNYLDLGGIPIGYGCSTGCSQGCPTATSVVSPSVGNNFFLTNNSEAWWQAVGAGVYAGSSAGGVTIDSDLPLSTARMVIPGTNDLAVVVRASGNVSTGEGEISDENWSVASPYKGKIMDYRFFASKMGVTPGTTNDFSSGTIQESNIFGLNQDFYYVEDTVDDEISLGDVWTVSSGESYVIFVDGDLRINKNVTVDPGGFLAFIVNGGVTVSTNVTSMQGIYVMNDLFVTETLDPVNDSQLVIEGMVVAWGGVSINRYLGGLINRTVPAEQFVYRADLLTNMPPKMKSFALNWQEVVPGTFD